MNRNDAIMSILAHCNKLRDGMIKEGNPDAEGYEFLQGIENQCLFDLNFKPEPEMSANGQGVGAIIPGAGVQITGTGDYTPPVGSGVCGGLEGVGRV